MKYAMACLLSILTFALAVVAAESPNAGSLAARSVAPESYQMKVRDLVSFSVLNEPETAGEQRIDGQGRIRVPYLDTMTIAGMTVREAEDLLERTYIANDIYITPQITVRVVEYAVREVSVLGEVNKPGNIALPIEADGLDIREVISQAGGFTNIARSRKVVVTRRMGNSKETFEVDVDDMLRKGKSGASSGFLVQAGDVVYVPERFF